jgi:Fe-S-cluster containining protein
MSAADQMAEQTMHPATRIDVRLEALEASLAAGLRFSNDLGASTQRELRDQKALLYTVVELLMGKGVLHLNELEARRPELAKSLEQSQSARSKVYLVDAPDKYKVEDPPVIDCENRYALCRGSCCRLWFSLSVQDLDERLVKWNYTQPYAIAQGADGRCVHQDRTTYQCGVYQNRPHVCRTYDCRKDKRIWLDFDRRIPNPALDDPNWPRVPDKVPAPVVQEEAAS